ncbi:MAG: tetratricopeptide repeat protein [Gallionella sp.]
MSVVNQVLNELEQRGAQGATENDTIRAVAPARGNHVVHLLAIALGVAVVLAAWIWLSLKQLEVRPAPIPAMEGKVGYKEPGTVVLASSSVAATDLALPVAPVGTTRDEHFKPASRLSLELGSRQPLPAEKTKPVQSAKTEADVVAKRSDPPVSRSAPVPNVAPKSKSGGAAQDSVAPMKRVSSKQQADAEFRRAAKLMQLGRIADAISGYEAALSLDAGHDAARQALVALLLDAKRNSDAELVLTEGLDHAPENTQLTMLLARLQLERGELGVATATLEKSLQFADGQPEYRAFFAALLQRQQRHEEALLQYRIVLQQAPGNGLWLMGYAMSLQATKRNAEAKEVFQRAIDSKSLSPELQVFVNQKLREL